MYVDQNNFKRDYSSWSNNQAGNSHLDQIDTGKT